MGDSSESESLPMPDALSTARDGPVARLRLERPDLHNAFDAALVAALTTALETLAADDGVRVVVLEGSGRSFSAGADLNWMRGMAAAGEAENREDALALARLMRTLDELPKATVARVHGAAFGGGVGLVACCDIAIGVPEAKFGLTESRLGLLPAVISPYVVAAIGARQARRWFATGETFDAARAREIGLLHEVVDAAGQVQLVVTRLGIGVRVEQKIVDPVELLPIHLGPGRQVEHRAGFPDFMDLLVVCADAGLSMEASLDRVGRELADSYPSLGANIHMATLEIRAGRSLSEALEHLGDRLGLEESRSFATLLQQSEELGSSMTDALRVYSDDMRHKRLSRAEEKAYSLPAKLSVPLVLCVFPVLVIVIMLPAYVRLKAGL